MQSRALCSAGSRSAWSDSIGIEEVTVIDQFACLSVAPKLTVCDRIQILHVEEFDICKVALSYLFCQHSKGNK